MNPSLQIILRTLKASLEEHVIPELDSRFARGQAGQVAVALEWLAQGLEEPLQWLQEGNAAIRSALEGVEGELERLSEEDAEQRDHWQAARRNLRAVLDDPAKDTAEGRQEERARFFQLLDDLVIAAGTPVGGDTGVGPLWAQLTEAMGAVAVAETKLGAVPLPQEHWR
jgi:hypothetical protein